MANKPAILFDCFGVLYSNGLSHFYGQHPGFRERNATHLAEITRQINLGEMALAESFRIYQTLGIDMSTEAIKDAIFKNVVLDKTLAKEIKKLKRGYLIGVLTNAGQEEIEIIDLDQVGVPFDAVTVSSEVGVVKPDEAIYLAAAEMLGTAIQSCILVDDNQANIHGATQAGMGGILYPEFGVIPDELSRLVNGVLT